MNALPHPDNLHVNAAEGWLMLGDVQAAREELTKLAPSSQAHPEVLDVRWSVHAAKGEWQEAFQAAQQIVTSSPECSYGWVHRAYAARRKPGGGLSEAWDALRPAADLFPKVDIIPYNLACYAAQMGRADEAWTWLRKAMKAGRRVSRIREMALADSDLEPLWPRLQSETKSSE
jgi:Flp pilus assembly protein TadD